MFVNDSRWSQGDDMARSLICQRWTLVLLALVVAAPSARVQQDPLRGFDAMSKKHGRNGGCLV